MDFTDATERTNAIDPTHAAMPADPLAAPLALPCGAVLPNRLCKAAMTEGLGDAQLRAWAQAGTVAGNHLWMQISHASRWTGWPTAGRANAAAACCAASLAAQSSRDGWPVAVSRATACLSKDTKVSPPSQLPSWAITPSAKSPFASSN